MKKFLFTNLLGVLCIFLSILAYSQNTEIDSVVNLANSYPSDDTTKVNLLNQAAKKCFIQDFNKAFELSSNAKALAEQLDYTDGLALAYRIQGIYYTVNINVEEAFAALNKAYELYEQSGNVQGKATVLSNLGLAYTRFKQDSLDLAINMIKESIELFGQINDVFGKSNSMVTLGNLYIQQGDYIEAIKTFNEVLETQLRENDPRQIAVCFINLGDVYQKFGDTDLALENFMKASEYLEKSNERLYLMDCYGNIGNIFYDKGKLEEALTYMERSLAISDSLGNPRPSIFILINVGNVYKDQGKSQKALEKFQEALTISDSLRYQEGILQATNSIGKFYNLQGNYTEAFNYASRALRMAVKQNNLEVQRDCNELLSIIYEKEDNPKKAHEHYKEFKLLTDSILNEENIKEVARLQAKYENEKEKQALMLEQEKREALLAAENRRQRITRNAFVVGFFLTLLLVFVILRSFLQKRKANKILSAQKEEIASQAEQLRSANKKLVELDQFKQGMTSMIVHDLKNPLNTILNVSGKDPVIEIERSRHAAGQMLNMVLNILDVNKYENSVMTIRKTEFSVFNKVQKAINQISFLAHQKNIFIENNIDTSRGVLGEPEVIVRVFVNLLSNAVKYTPVNGKIEISSQIDEKKEQVILSVKDTGQGISKEYHEKVFEKFTQVEATSSEGVHSTGLGLTFCRMAVEAHDGKIWIDHNYTGGACVSFSLPTKDVQENILSEQTDLHTIPLNMHEKAILRKYLPQLEKYELFEISAFRKLFREIESESNMSWEWLQQVKKAVDYGNEELFKKLIGQIIL